VTAASTPLLFLPLLPSLPLFPPFLLATARESRGVFKLPQWVCVEPSSQMRLGAFWAEKSASDQNNSISICVDAQNPGVSME